MTLANLIEPDALGGGAAAPDRRPRWAGGGAGFEDLMRITQLGDAAADRAKPAPEDRLHQAARQLVATTLLAPLLAQARNDPFKTDLFHGGQGEELFGAQLDTLLADRLVQRTDLAVVDAIVKRMGQVRARASAPPLAAPAGQVDTHG